MEHAAAEQKGGESEGSVSTKGPAVELPAVDTLALLPGVSGELSPLGVMEHVAAEQKGGESEGSEGSEASTSDEKFGASSQVSKEPKSDAKKKKEKLPEA